jgi:hypothetical protein
MPLAASGLLFQIGIVAVPYKFFSRSAALSQVRKLRRAVSSEVSSSRSLLFNKDVIGGVLDSLNKTYGFKAAAALRWGGGLG